ncbi:hypothetical protein F5Y16DRAFT_378905 [Xylariaceae sp. FL0255]|nr:hypothetical protein F5Y16DRAFT_378905 [Xylariaceae sp. FL0255]
MLRRAATQSSHTHRIYPSILKSWRSLHIVNQSRKAWSPCITQSYSPCKVPSITKSRNSPMERLFSVPTSGVDPTRLSSLLKGKFGRGGYRIEMRHSTYRVYAKYGLPEDEYSAFIHRLR